MLAFSVEDLRLPEHAGIVFHCGDILQLGNATVSTLLVPVVNARRGDEDDAGSSRTWSCATVQATPVGRSCRQTKGGERPDAQGALATEQQMCSHAILPSAEQPGATPTAGPAPLLSASEAALPIILSPKLAPAAKSAAPHCALCQLCLMFNPRRMQGWHPHLGFQPNLRLRWLRLRCRLLEKRVG